MRHGFARAAFAAALLAAIAAFWPVSTRVGVNYEVTGRRIPLWEKSWLFLDRHRRTAALAERLGTRFSDDEERTLALLSWTRQHIRPHPAAVAVVDDHVWSIIQRGYGSNDQMADVFTTLLAYTGVRAWWRLIGPQRPTYPIAFALIDGEWRVFDVEHGISFRDSSGALASDRSIAADPQIVRAGAASAGLDPETYSHRFEGFSPVLPPATLRAELQMPHARLRHEVCRRAIVPRVCEPINGNDAGRR